MEHINRECKRAMGTLKLGSNITNETVERIGRSNGEVMKVKKQFDHDNRVPVESDEHSKRSADKDLEQLLVQLQEANVFFPEGGRT